MALHFEFLAGIFSLSGFFELFSFGVLQGREASSRMPLVN